MKKEQGSENLPEAPGEAGPGALALPEDLAGMFDLKENMKGVLPRLPQIGIVHQGQMFKFPDDTKKSNFIGIILHKNFCNAWWKEPFDKTGGGTPPDCSSLDAITPDYNSPEVQAEKCLKCQWNQFKSDGGRGKACKNMARVHVLLENDPTPYRLTLSPGNLRPMSDYISEVTLRGYPFQLVYTEFNLVSKKNKDGIEYSEIVMKNVGTIKSKETAATIRQQMDNWMPAFVGQQLEAEEM